MPASPFPTHVPRYDLSSQAKAGVLVRDLQQAAPAAGHDSAAPHRDTHYLLVLLTQGELHLRVDFEAVALIGSAMLLVSPGQVHQLLGTTRPQGWGVSFEPNLLAAEWQLLLEQGLARPPQLATPAPFYARAEALLLLLADCQAGAADAYTGPTLHALLTALLSLVAGQLAPDPTLPRPPETRGQLLARAFEDLLRQHYAQWKQPAQYAAALAITGAHLNDTVKAQTRRSVSTHIQQRAVLEAKRLLYTTARSVQEIGYALGYDEPRYFGKLFKKVTGLTPQQFRRAIRE